MELGRYVVGANGAESAARSLVKDEPPKDKQKTDWGEMLALATDRLSRRHISHRGTYFRIRKFLSLLGLGVLWLYMRQSQHPLDIHAIWGASIAARRLLLASAITSLWWLGTMRQHRRGASSQEILESETLRVAGTSLMCGISFYSVSLFWTANSVAATHGLILAASLFVSWVLLLLGTLAVTSGVAPSLSRARKALIMGSGPRAVRLREDLKRNHISVEVIGCLDNEYIGTDEVGDGYAGDLSNLPMFLKEHPIELVLIGLPVKSHYKEIQSVIEVCEAMGIELHYPTDVFAPSRVMYRPVGNSLGFSILGELPHGFGRWIKRSIDLAVAVPLLILVSPLMLLIAAVIRLTSEGPIFFVQQRFGLHRRCFPMFKFRTMVVDAERRQAALESLNEAQGPVFKIKADPRITKIGSFLRRTSLDELPQLFNILRGEMSLVGPRPLPQRDVARFDENWLLRRFSVTPGLTCLWQVKGRSNTSFDEWIRLDLEYIDRWSLRLDVSILLQTIPVLIRGTGAM